MAVLFVKEKFVDPYIVAIDSTLLRAKGHLWHKSSMIKGVIPCSGIDIDARAREPLIEHIKEVFRIDPLPVRGHQKGAAIVPLSVLIYQIMVYYNCKTGNKQPKAIKHMLGS